MYEDCHNHGGHTVNISAAGLNYSEQNVEAISIAEEERLWLSANNPIFYKSDVESMDETLASALSSEFWAAVIGGMIEVRAEKGKIFDEARIEKMLDAFPNKRLEKVGTGNISTTEVIDAMNKTDGGNDDLLFWR